VKDNFLIIPDFPNYEINSELLVRNKKTGKFLKPVLQRGNLFVGLHNGIHCKRVSRSLKYCRELALAATAKTIFYPVPSLGGKYEISKSGVLRSAARKYALKLDKKNAYCVTIDKQNKRVSRKFFIKLNSLFTIWSKSAVAFLIKFRKTFQFAHSKNVCSHPKSDIMSVL